jgi:crotonobetaine/carnitine-CoA ligase
MIKHESTALGGGTPSGLLSARADYCRDNIALEFQGRTFTYGDFDREVSAVAAGLMGLGLKHGDAASIFLSNRPEYLFAWFGINRAGLVTVFVNTAYKGSFLSYGIEHSESKVIFTEASLLPELLALPVLPPVLRFIVCLDGLPGELPDSSGVRLLSLEDLLSAAAPNTQFPRILPEHPGTISFTSGTTGKSKGAVTPNMLNVVFGKEAADAFGFSSQDRVYTCMPLFHGMAQMTSVVASLHVGATLILSEKFSLRRFWDEIRDSRATEFNLVGSMLYMLLSPPPSPRDRDHQVTRVFSAPAPADVLYRFESRFGLQLIEGYGQTEIKNVLYNPLKGRKVGSMGIPTPSTILEVHDDTGAKVAPGVIGEIVYRPRLPNIMLKEYYRDPEATLANMQGLWWHTGDLGSMDEDGFFYFSGRKKDSMRRRGENISSNELESAAALFPGIGEVAAVATRSDVGEDEVMIVFESAKSGNFDFKALFAHCVASMPRFMVPRYYRIIDALPRTPNGKVRKVELREAGVTADTWDHVAAGLMVPR